VFKYGGTASGSPHGINYANDHDSEKRGRRDRCYIRVLMHIRSGEQPHESPEMAIGDFGDNMNTVLAEPGKMNMRRAIPSHTTMTKNWKVIQTPFQLESLRNPSSAEVEARNF